MNDLVLVNTLAQFPSTEKFFLGKCETAKVSDVEIMPDALLLICAGV